jgi:hypothetical protein
VKLVLGVSRGPMPWVVTGVVYDRWIAVLSAFASMDPQILSVDRVLLAVCESSACCEATAAARRFACCDAFLIWCCVLEVDNTKTIY